MEAFAEAQAAFTALGAAAGTLESHRADFHHGYAAPNREALYGFFQRTLRHPGNASEVPLTPLPVDKLYSTKTGQVL